jgi:hypothetical protein
LETVNSSVDALHYFVVLTIRISLVKV